MLESRSRLTDAMWLKLVNFEFLRQERYMNNKMNTHLIVLTLVTPGNDEPLR